MKRIRQFFEYLAAFLIILFLLIMIAGTVIIKFYSEDLRDQTVHLLNEQLDTRIDVGEIGISVFRSFPNTAVYLSDVVVWAGNADTLLHAERLYLRFNLLHLLNKKYQIRSLEARNGHINLLIDPEGKGNFMIGRKQENRDRSRFLEMKGVSVTNMHVQYSNLAKELNAEVMLKEMYFEGDLFEQEFNLSAGGRAFVHVIENHDINYLEDQEIRTSISFNVNQGHYTIRKGEVTLGELAAAVSGSVQPIKQGETALDLHFSGKRIGIEMITGLLKNRVPIPEGLKSRGIIDLTADVEGVTGPARTPRIKARFRTAGAEVSGPGIPHEIQSISLSGSYDNGTNRNIQSTTIALESLSAIAGKSRISGSFRLNNLLQPTFVSTFSGDISAVELQKFIEQKQIEISDGKILPELSVEGKIRRMPGSDREVTFSTRGNLGLEMVEFRTVQGNIFVETLNGTIGIDPENWQVNLTGMINQTTLDVKLNVNQPLAALSTRTDLVVDGSVHGKHLDIDQLMKSFGHPQDGERTVEFPRHVKGAINFQFDRISRGKIHTREVAGKLIYDHPSLYLNPVSLKTLQGTIRSEIMLSSLDQPKHKLNIHTSFDQVEIRDIFDSFDDFGQDFITRENLSGNITGTSDLSAMVHPDLSISIQDIVSTSNLEIENGRLTNFEPLMGMSDFLKTGELDDIRFSTITNTVMIRDNLITIPEMDIRSSALNIQASGTHGFNRKYEYHLATRLSEILFRKAQSASDREFDIALDKNDQRTIFLVISDDGTGMEVNFDETQALKKIRQDLRDEKTELKVLLNREYGLFRKDTTLTTEESVPEQPVMKFDFSPSEQADSTQSVKNKRSKWWKKEQQESKKPVIDFVFDDDL